MKRNALLMLTLALAAGSLAAGCGDDDDEDGGGLTKKEYVAHGNAICEEGNAEIESDLEALGPGGPTPEEFSSVVVPATQNEIGALRALPAPDGDEETLSELLDEAQAALNRIKATPAIAFGDDPFAVVNAKANEYGLTACAR
jgi:hypothetical protein